VWIALEREDSSLGVHRSAGNCAVKAEIGTNVEDDGIRSKKAAKDENRVRLDRSTEQVGDRVERIGIDGDIFS
jgi:hypothetical protein